LAAEHQIHLGVNDLLGVREPIHEVVEHHGGGVIIVLGKGNVELGQAFDIFGMIFQQLPRLFVAFIGTRVAIFSTGAIFEEISESLEILSQNGISPAVYTFPTVKPLDEEVIKECAEKFDLIVTCEEHNVVAGFGSAVAEVMAEMKANKAQLLRIGLNDEYSIKVGNQRYLREQYGMDGKSIAEKILKTI
jgi:transketolase